MCNFKEGNLLRTAAIEQCKEEMGEGQFVIVKIAEICRHDVVDLFRLYFLLDTHTCLTLYFIMFKICDL